MEAVKLSAEALVAHGRDLTFVTIENADHPDDYVQLQLHDGVVCAEVGSREWSEPFAPLSPDAIIALGNLGFVGGGAKQNYVRDELPKDPAQLAPLVQRLFNLAYGRGPKIDVVVSTNSADVYSVLKEEGCWVGRLLTDELTKVGPINMEDVERLLRRRGCAVYKDATDGELVTFWGWDNELGTSLRLWFRTDGATFRIAGSSDRPLIGRRRTAEVLRAINDWNVAQRWPKAVLATGQPDKSHSWVWAGMEVPVGAGIHRAMVENLVDTAVTSTIAFFKYMHERIDWSTISAGKSPLPAPPGRG